MTILPNGLKKGDRVVVESPLFQSFTGRYERSNYPIGSYGTVVGADEGLSTKPRPDNVRVRFDGFDYADIHLAAGLLKVSHLADYASVRAPRFKVGDYVSGTVTMPKRGESRATRITGRITTDGAGSASPSETSVIDVQNGQQRYVATASLRRSVMAAPVKKEAPAPALGTATLKVEVRFYIGEVDVTRQIKEVLGVNGATA